jgi:hypothetical protein
MFLTVLTVFYFVTVSLSKDECIGMPALCDDGPPPREEAEDGRQDLRTHPMSCAPWMRYI